MKKYTVYGNCQADGLAKTLLEYEDFSSNYEYIPLKAVQDMQVRDIPYVEQTMGKCDLIIYQHISRNYSIAQLSTTNLLPHISSNTRLISFPSLYFGAYFPHLGTFNGVKSILNLVHDYVIMYGYVLGIEQQRLLEIIQSDYFYYEALSQKLLRDSLEFLRKREESNKVDVRISDFVAENYSSKKLFNQFNHPKRPVLEHVSIGILDILNMSQRKNLGYDEEMNYLDNIITPIYRSTYINLGLKFNEDFNSYKGVEGFITMPHVISAFYATYGNMDEELIRNKVVSTKPFIIHRFNELLPAYYRNYFILFTKNRIESKLSGIASKLLGSAILSPFISPLKHILIGIRFRKRNQY